MKTTIKQRAISSISFCSVGIPRKELVYSILKLNGTLKIGDWEQFDLDFNSKWRGYYSVSFQEWEEQGLITRQKGIYKATELGKAYAHNPKILKELNEIKRRHREQRYELFCQFRDLRTKYNNLVNQLDKVIINA